MKRCSKPALLLALLCCGLPCLCQAANDVCGGIHRGYQYTISAPAYPGALDCEYELQSAEAANNGDGCEPQFHLQFLDFELATSENCRRDYLRVGDKNIYCGRTTGLRKFTAKNGALKLNYHSERASNGFKILVTSMPCKLAPMKNPSQESKLVEPMEPQQDNRSAKSLYERRETRGGSQYNPSLGLAQLGNAVDGLTSFATASSERPTVYRHQINFNDDSPSGTSQGGSKITSYLFLPPKEEKTSDDPASTALVTKAASSRQLAATSDRRPLPSQKSISTVYGNSQSGLLDYDSKLYPGSNYRTSALAGGYGQRGSGSGVIYDPRFNLLNSNQAGYNGASSGGNSYLPSSYSYSYQTNGLSNSLLGNYGNRPSDYSNGYSNDYPNDYSNGYGNSYSGGNYNHNNNYYGSSYGGGYGNGNLDNPESSIPSGNVGQEYVGTNYNGAFNGAYNGGFNGVYNGAYNGVYNGQQQLIGSEQCCRVAQGRRISIVSPGFGAGSNGMYGGHSCRYFIPKAGRDVCRLRLSFRYFNFGADTDPFCQSGYVEIDGRRHCGCRTGQSFLLPFNEFTGKSISLVHSSHQSRSKYSGFLIDVSQESCGYAQQQQQQPGYPGYEQAYPSIYPQGNDYLQKRSDRNATVQLDASSESKSRSRRSFFGYEYKKPSVAFNLPAGLARMQKRFFEGTCQSRVFIDWAAASREAVLKRLTCAPNYSYNNYNNNNWSAYGNSGAYLSPDSRKATVGDEIEAAQPEQPEQPCQPDGHDQWIRSVVAGPLVDSWQIVRLVDRAFGVGTVRGSVDNDERRIPRPGLQNQSQHDVGETRNFRFVGIIF
uniref:CUB domain-containing protein n=1 Tax=Trichogramma kaykai TaxID=54128 RepID=A0ABD2VSD9_9HYME